MPEARLVAIHQPNFLPWLGFFDKLVRCDVFVLLDDVQFPRKSAGCWTNRVQICVAGKPAWLTVPIVRSFHGTQLTNQIQISADIVWRSKALNTLRHSYARADFFSSVYPWVERAILCQAERLVDYNALGLSQLLEAMELPKKEIVWSSELNVHGVATERLIEIVKKVRGTSYLCGAGASGYQEDWRFEQEGLRAVHQNFEHPVYPQGALQQFIPGLSVIDALMHCGVGGVRSLLQIQEVRGCSAPGV